MNSKYENDNGSPKCERIMNSNSMSSNTRKRSHSDVASTSSPNQPGAKKFKYNSRDKMGRSGKSQVSSNSVIVFDFDDTLFPTSKYFEIMAEQSEVFCRDKSDELQSKMTRTDLKELVDLSQATFNLLSAYIKRYSYDNIYIVSASGNGWIKIALQNVDRIGHFKQIYELLFDSAGQPKLSIIHPTIDLVTNYSYQNITEHPCYQYKFIKFQEIFLNKYLPSVETRSLNNFVFIGDAYYEYLAAKKLQNEIECDQDINDNMDMTVFIHRIKLATKPTFTLLTNEHLLLEKLCKGQYFEKNSRDHNEAVDIVYEKEMKSYS